MPEICSAFACFSKQKEVDEEGNNISFHRFPLKKPAKLKLWLIAMRTVDGRKPTTSSVICGKHFRQQDFKTDDKGLKKRFLRDDAVPSVFDFPEHLRSKIKQRKPPAKRQPLQVRGRGTDDHNKEINSASPGPAHKVAVNVDHKYTRSPLKTIKKLRIAHQDCASALTVQSPSQDIDHPYTKAKTLTECKTYGNLINPSESVVEVVTQTDRCLRRHLPKWQDFNQAQIREITTEILQITIPTVFPSLLQHSMSVHVLDDQLRDSHTTALVKDMVAFYIQIFCHQFATKYQDCVVAAGKPSKRQKLTRLIIFNNE